MKKKLFYYTGAVHIHSKFSDGTGDIYEISKSAKNAGLDWIIITDHNSLAIEEGIYNDVCVIKGEEISPQNCNHYLALNINNVIQPNNPNVYIEDVRRQGGFGFAAHPDESENRRNHAKPLKWSDKSIAPDGVEIWNWFSDWADNYDESNIFKIAYAYLFKHNLIKGPHPETLKWWDDLNRQTSEIVPAIGGVDAHALKISKYIFPVKVFPYKTCFRTLANIITLKEKIPDNFEEQKQIILNSLKSGNNIIINRHVRDEIPLISVDNRCIFVKLSVKSQIKIIYDGKCVREENSKVLKYEANQNGKYRIEVFLNGKPWIYSNPVMIC